jgi:hypothetical protein
VWKDIHYVTGGNFDDYFRFGLYVTDFRGFYYRNTTTHPYLNISSAYNGGLSGESVYYYKGINCSGSDFVMQASTGDSDYTNGSPSGSWNDQTVSGAYATQISKCRLG